MSSEKLLSGDEEYRSFVKTKSIMKKLSFLPALGYIGLAVWTFFVNQNGERKCLGVEGALYLIIADYLAYATGSILFLSGIQ